MQAQARIKLAEIEERIANLVAIRDTLRQALAAGCDDLVACVESQCCLLPFITPRAAQPDARSGQDDAAR